MTHRLLIVLAFLMLPLSAAHSFETRATAAYVIDQTTGTVLLAKNASKPLPPASMSKLMTLYMAITLLGISMYVIINLVIIKSILIQ